jgi:hypothetical protein
VAFGGVNQKLNASSNKALTSFRLTLRPPVAFILGQYGWPRGFSSMKRESLFTVASSRIFFVRHRPAVRSMAKLYCVLMSALNGEHYAGHIE